MDNYASADWVHVGVLVAIDLSSEQPDVLLRLIEAEIRRRSSTDRKMGAAWMTVPILPILAGIVFLVALVGIVVTSLPTLQQPATSVPAVAGIMALYFSALAAVYIVLIVEALALYFMIDRRNRHFKRQQLLFATIPRYLLASKSFANHENIGRLAELSEDSIFEEQIRPAGIWAILSIFAAPLLILIVAYSLTQDLRKHEERQTAYHQTLPLALGEAGIAYTPTASPRTHARDPIAYIVLTVITAGLFWVYWFYVLLRDYNEHFKNQAALEDQLLVSLKPARTCASCGGSIPENARFCPLCGTAQPAMDTPDRT
jgi:hypothetical protein